MVSGRILDNHGCNGIEEIMTCSTCLCRLDRALRRALRESSGIPVRVLYRIRYH
jgi:hypothetical protein